MPRGGKRIGSGRPRKSLNLRLLSGKGEAAEATGTPQRLKDFAEGEGLGKGSMEFADAEERIKSWLAANGLQDAVPSHFIYDYSLQIRRINEIEKLISEQGVSPSLLKAAQTYRETSLKTWGAISAIIAVFKSEHCSGAADPDDPMEQLLK